MFRDPKYRLHKASNRAVVTINGKDYYLGEYRSVESKRKYDKLIAEWKVCQQSPVFGTDAEYQTVKQVIAAYLKYQRTRFGTSKNSEYRRGKPVFKTNSRLVLRPVRRPSIMTTAYSAHRSA